MNHGDQVLLQGAALYQLVEGSEQVTIARRRDIHECAYVVDAGRRTAVLLKHSTRPRSWPFTFTGTELRALESLAREVTEELTFVGLVCSRDGVCCLRAREVFSLLAQRDGGNQQVRVRRLRAGRYRVTGPSGAELHHRIPVNAWPRRLLGADE